MSEKNGGGPIDLGEDDGYVEVIIAGEKQRLDVWEVHWRLVEASRDAEPLEAARRYGALLKQLGFATELSAFAGDRFARAIFKRVDELVKKNSPEGSAKPDSAASTASTASG